MCDNIYITEELCAEDRLTLIHKEELLILSEIKQICENNNLRFFMLGGTFLGAIRHKGFIPWDDDGDIGLPRRDYEKFVELYNEYGSFEFELITMNDEKSQYNYACKLQSKRVKVLDNSCIESKETGAWIDIFPIDGVPDNMLLFAFHKFNLVFHRALWKLSDSGNIGADKKSRSKLENLVIACGTKIHFEKVLNKKKRLFALNRVMKKYDFDKQEYNLNYLGAYKFKEMFPKSLYAEVAYYPFENIELPGPKNYDFYLKQLYGDYMTPPQVSERNKHNTVLLSEHLEI